MSWDKIQEPAVLSWRGPVRGRSHLLAGERKALSIPHTGGGIASGPSRVRPSQRHKTYGLLWITTPAKRCPNLYKKGGRVRRLR